MLAMLHKSIISWKLFAQSVIIVLSIYFLSFFAAIAISGDDSTIGSIIRAIFCFSIGFIVARCVTPRYGSRQFFYVSIAVWLIMIMIDLMLVQLTVISKWLIAVNWLITAGLDAVFILASWFLANILIGGIYILMRAFKEGQVEVKDNNERKGLSTPESDESEHAKEP